MFEEGSEFMDYFLSEEADEDDDEQPIKQRLPGCLTTALMLITLIVVLL